MKTSNMKPPPSRLPITRDLTLVYLLSLIVALIIAVSSVVGLLFRAVIYPTSELLLSFVSSDGFNLVVGLPILLVVLQAHYAASPIDLIGIVAVLVMAALCFVPFAYFVRGAASDRSSSPA